MVFEVTLVRRKGDPDVGIVQMVLTLSSISSASAVQWAKATANEFSRTTEDNWNVAMVKQIVTP